VSASVAGTVTVQFETLNAMRRPRQRFGFVLLRCVGLVRGLTWLRRCKCTPVTAFLGGGCGGCGCGGGCGGGGGGGGGWRGGRGSLRLPLNTGTGTQHLC
jgi:hypothetical protein